LNPVNYSVCGIGLLAMQQKPYKTRLTDLNKLKQRLRTE